MGILPGAICLKQTDSPYPRDRQPPSFWATAEVLRVSVPSTQEFWLASSCASDISCYEFMGVTAVQGLGGCWKHSFPIPNPSPVVPLSPVGMRLGCWYPILGLSLKYWNNPHWIWAWFPLQGWSDRNGKYDPFRLRCCDQPKYRWFNDTMHSIISASYSVVISHMSWISNSRHGVNWV